MPTSPPEEPTLENTLLVACLCADWCGTCREYKPLFAQLQQEFPTARFLWIDIEDQADLVDPLEVDNFPTLLIAAQGQPRFFGTVMPHLETLRRLIQSLQGESHSSPAGSAEVQSLLARLNAMPNQAGALME